SGWALETATRRKPRSRAAGKWIPSETGGGRSWFQRCPAFRRWCQPSRPGKPRLSVRFGREMRSVDESSCRWGRIQLPGRVRQPSTLSTVALQCPGSCSALSEILRDRLPVHDPRGDEDQQLLAVVAFGGAPEEEAQQRKLAK